MIISAHNHYTLEHITLEERRPRGDLIQINKIIHEIENINLIKGSTLEIITMI